LNASPKRQQKVSANEKEHPIQALSKLPIIVGINPQEAISQRQIHKIVEVLEMIQLRRPLGRSVTK